METGKIPPPRAPWRDILERHLAEMPATEFTLATISQDAHGKPHPCARTCIFRSFWADLKLRDSARAELQRQDQASDETTGTAAGTNKNVEQNAALYDSDMLSFTTDVRMDKVGHIMSGGGDEDGGGGEVECVFWVKAVSTQWRLKGRASVVGASSEDNVEKKSREEIWQWMRTRSTHNVSPSGKAAESWSWEKEITAHFANLSPIMRGSFKNPPPGKPRPGPVRNPSLRPGQKVYDLHDTMARRNFRVVVIHPTEVESLDLTDPENGKRVKWNLTLKAGPKTRSQWRWEEKELWP